MCMAIKVKSTILKIFSVSHAGNDLTSFKNLLNIKQTERTIIYSLKVTFFTRYFMDRTLPNINFPHELCLDYLNENRHCIVKILM